MNREVVPDWRASMRASTEIGRTGFARIVTVPADSSRSTAEPSSAIESSIARVSSANNAPRRVDVPDARAAHISARLVMLFEPGGLIAMSGGPGSGDTTKTFG